MNNGDYPIGGVEGTATEVGLGMGIARIGNRLRELDVQRAIEIYDALNGYVVKVGCKHIVFETKEKMLSEISRYLDNRAAVEKEYLARAK